MKRSLIAAAFAASAMAILTGIVAAKDKTAKDALPPGSVSRAEGLQAWKRIDAVVTQDGLPRAVVEPLGALDDTETVATQFVITPFVALVRAPVAWQPDGREIEKVIEVPLAALRDRANLRVEYRERAGAQHEVLFWDYQGETIWGATARILKHYLDLLEGA